MNINEALNSFASFLRELRFSERIQLSISGDLTYFTDEQLGGMTLTGKERHEYIRCVDYLAQAVEKGDLFSRRGLEHLLQKALLMAWNGEQGLEQIPEARIKSAKKWLKEALQASPKRYLVYVP